MKNTLNIPVAIAPLVMLGGDKVDAFAAGLCLCMKKTATKKGKATVARACKELSNLPNPFRGEHIWSYENEKREHLELLGTEIGFVLQTTAWLPGVPCPPETISFKRLTDREALVGLVTSFGDDAECPFIKRMVALIKQ